ncbi:MAG: endonuclease/exonuclease/phosphatase family protein [Steroidobacteraceae bacterium]
MSAASLRTGSAAPPIRVLTLNTHQGFSALRRHKALLRIRDGLRTAGADLVFLQEVGAAHGAETPGNQYEVLADGVWAQHAYGRNAVTTGGHHGNALLSKYPIAAWRNVDASIGKAEPRGMLHCVLHLPTAPVPLHAICVHLALRESHRRQQVELLLDLVATKIPDSEPLVIAGDFNDWRERAHSRLSRVRGLEEIHAGVNGHPARTFPARMPVLRLDHIYVRNLSHRPLQLPRRPWSTLSDHVPLAGELRLQGL